MWSKKDIAVGIIVLLILLVVIFVILPKGTEKTGYELIDYEAIVKTQSPYMKDVLLDHVSQLKACVAISNNNITMCELMNSTENINDCKAHYNNYVIYNNFIEGRCSAVPQEYRSICENILSGNCDIIDNVTFRKVCVAFSNEDITLCEEDEICERSITLYLALKNKNSNECDKIEKFYNKELCKGLLLNDCQERIDLIARDWSYLSIAKQFDDLSLCNKITNNEIKTLCLNKDLTSYEAMTSL